MVAVSEKIRNELIEIRVPSERVSVIKNGVDLQEFHPGPTDEENSVFPKVFRSRSLWETSEHRVRIWTYTQSLVGVPELHLAVVGSTAGSPYPQLARQLGLSARVHFLDYRRDVSQLMRAADLFVFPSRYEAFPLVLLEAMASGLPVVTVTTAGAADLVSAGCGVVVDDPNDVSAFAVALKRFGAVP